ncbi:glycosyltransferase [Peredibacter starrii]|uniref:Glycosyltransferase n=1 Tax=Peredibacter starrii TaxID=28202 RepID=A0AAX4HRA8_9BACT|nr:glycosyltransferase [Peredibacter starrii]WPU65834.1 glycosyltransferase [Peredibacter starrii]
MNLLFLCKASEKIGLGHLVRSRSLARFLSKKPGIIVDFHVIEQNFDRLSVGENISYSFFANESDHKLSKDYDLIFLDMLNVGEELFRNLKQNSKLVLLSPVFNKINEVDFFFHRTSYHPSLASLSNVRKYAGLDYSIISDECIRIAETRYRENLNTLSLPIAISMGGGDANNKTLKLLKNLKNCKAPVTFWVLLGEGYSHSYDELVKEVTKDTTHEVILVRSNRHMWHVLQNCALGIFPGGITVYEAAYAGLPSVVIVEDDAQAYLVEELVEKGVCLTISASAESYPKSLVEVIDGIFKDRSKLLNMHASSVCIDGHGKERIFNLINDFVKESR